MAVEVPLDGMRKTIAARLIQAKQTIPHFYLTIDCVIDKLLSAREEINASAPKNKEGKPAYIISGDKLTHQPSDDSGRILVVAPGRDERLELSARNLPTVEIILADSLNVVDLLSKDDPAAVGLDTALDRARSRIALAEQAHDAPVRADRAAEPSASDAR